MDIWFVCAACAVVAYFVLRGPWKQYRLGVHLTRMTNVFEGGALVGQMLGRQPTGIHGSTVSQRDADAILAAGMAYVAAYPRHVITRELVKNSLLAERTGRVSRALAIDLLFQALVEEGLALDTETFLRSYA